MRLPLTLAACLTAAPALADGIVPKDGTWLSKTESVFFNDGCPQQAKSMMEPMVNAMTIQDTMEIDFGGVFDPARIDEANQAGTTWTQIDANTWQGSMPHPETGQGVVASIRIQAISPTEIDGQMQMDFGLLMAGEPGFGEMFKGCAATVDSLLTHQG